MAFQLNNIVPWGRNFSEYKLMFNLSDEDLKLENLRMSAMKIFLNDYENGKRENRYICHELPEQLPFEEGSFDLGLSSHFLLMYTILGYDFHIQAIMEMLRICKEIRIFPSVDLDVQKTKLVSEVINYFESFCDVEVKHTQYEFQKGENKLLIIRNKK